MRTNTSFNDIKYVIQCKFCVAKKYFETSDLKNIYK